MDNVLKTIQNNVIVSVQASGDEPLNQPAILTAMAESALNGGAVGVRLAGIASIQHFKSRHTGIPVIGITKPEPMIDNPHQHVYITSTLGDAKGIIDAGSDIVATDATQRMRPDGLSLKTWVEGVKNYSDSVLLMADVATVTDGVEAEKLGFDVISTTLSGYTAETMNSKSAQAGQPDFDLLEALVKTVSCPVILEGRVWDVCDVTNAFELGAYAVVIGSVITRPHLITKRFVDAIPRSSL